MGAIVLNELKKKVKSYEKNNNHELGQWKRLGLRSTGYIATCKKCQKAVVINPVTISIEGSALREKCID